EKQKLSEGKDLIRYFCVPCKPTKANGGRTRNLPEHDREKWERFKAYNLRDVEAEMQIQQRLSKFPVPEFVWEEYWQDQEINDRGIGVDMEMVKNAIAMDGRSKAELSDAMKELTELENPNSVQQMKQWLLENGMETDSLDKKAVAAMLEDAPEPLKTVLTLRQQLARSSVKKYQAMENAVCADSRAHGMFQFYGANRTGRYSGRIIQLQNLPQNHIPDLAQARELVKAGDFDALSILYEDIPDTLSQLIRTAFVPQDGRKFIVADFSAIEARVIAWIAGERWRLKVFEGGGDIYCASASQMFHVPVEKHGVNGHLRQKGKIAELALGYGGSVGALKSMGALEMGLAEEELPPLVSAWRDSNPSITEFWWAVDRAVKECIKKRMPTETHGIRFSYESGMLFITLFSGRRLAYVK
ncbi:MAG: DNA polymerase, partial [Lachnospiraceae bacterium]|nr:DNA polymerase [Lachnospiraceae bacterium]